jgi:non-ribosomal peptide synthetase component E (peptide arylation enzyme)
MDSKSSIVEYLCQWRAGVCVPLPTLHRGEGPAQRAALSGGAYRTRGIMCHMGFPDSVLDALATRPEHPAVEHGDRLVTGGELLSMIGAIAAGLRSAGIGPGNGVAMDLDVSAESLAAYLAGYTLGCQVVGVHPGNSLPWRAGTDG